MTISAISRYCQNGCLYSDGDCLCQPFSYDIKGYRDAAGNALAIIAGSLIGVIAYYLCYLIAGYHGALIGLALVPALILLPAMVILIKTQAFCSQ